MLNPVITPETKPLVAKPVATKRINYPPVLIVGSSGSGKTRSIVGLPKDKTLIVNVERKHLPFKDALLYRQVETETFQQVIEELKRAFTNPEIDYIVVDSFTKFSELLFKTASDIHKGYDIYKFFNTEIGKFLEFIKGCGPRFLILLGIDELVKEMQPTGLEKASRRTAITGKQWEGKVEKEFAVVLFTEVKRKINEQATYTFLTNNDGTTSAKSPEGMFQLNIDNSLKLVCDTMAAYYGLPSKDTISQPVNTTTV